MTAPNKRLCLRNHQGPRLHNRPSDITDQDKKFARKEAGNESERGERTYQAPLAKGKSPDKETVRHEQGRKSCFFFQLSRGIAATVYIHQKSSTVGIIAIFLAFRVRRNCLIFSRRTRQRRCFDPSMPKAFVAHLQTRR